MSDQNDNQQGSDQSHIVTTEVIQTSGGPAPKVEEKPPQLDPYEMFKQIESMREEGLDDETIRLAFNEFMAERRGDFRKLVPRIAKTAESMPMPSPDDLLKFYEDQVKHIEMSPEMELLMTEIDKAQERKLQAEKMPKIRLRDRLGRWFAIKLLGATIWVCKRFGIK